MTLRWTLKQWLAVTYDIYRVADVQRYIFDKTGVEITPQALCSLINDTPRALRIATLQVICTAFQCNLSEFCEVVPGRARRRPPRRLYPGHGRRLKKRIADFPSADDRKIVPNKGKPRGPIR